MRGMIDPGSFAHTPAGIDRAEELASQTFGNMIDLTELTKTDTTIAAMFLLAEVLAALEVYSGQTATEAVRRIEQLTAAKVAELRDEPTAAEPSKPFGEYRGAAILH